MKNKKIENPKSISIKEKLKKIANEKQVAFQMVLNEFLLERIAVRISANKELNDALIFKGGFVSLKVYHSRRYTVDIDAVLSGQELNLIADWSRDAVEFVDEKDGSWFKFEAFQDLKTTGEYGGLRLIFRGGVGEPPTDIKRAQIINLDIGIGDPVFPGPREMVIPLLIDQASLSWKVYPVETIVSEKLHTLIERGEGNSRAKDIFDLSFLLPRVNREDLFTALTKTFEYRKTNLPAKLYNHLEGLDLKLLRLGWRQAMSSIRNPPQIDECWETVLNLLKKLDL